MLDRFASRRHHHHTPLPAHSPSYIESLQLMHSEADDAPSSLHLVLCSYAVVRTVLPKKSRKFQTTSSRQTALVLVMVVAIVGETYLRAVLGLDLQKPGAASQVVAWGTVHSSLGGSRSCLALDVLQGTHNDSVDGNLAYESVAAEVGLDDGTGEQMIGIVADACAGALVYPSGAKSIDHAVHHGRHHGCMLRKSRLRRQKPLPCPLSRPLLVSLELTLALVLGEELQLQVCLVLPL